MASRKYGVAAMQPRNLLNDDGKLTIPELKQSRFLRDLLRTLDFNLRRNKVNVPTLPTNGFSIPNIPITEITLTDKAKVADDRWTPLHFSDCLVNLQFS